MCFQFFESFSSISREILRYGSLTAYDKLQQTTCLCKFCWRIYSILAWKMRIKQQVYWYWYSAVKMLFGMKGRLLKTTRQNFLELAESLLKFSDQVFTKFAEVFWQSFRIWVNQNIKYCTQKLTFFGYYIQP